MLHNSLLWYTDTLHINTTGHHHGGPYKVRFSFILLLLYHLPGFHYGDNMVHLHILVSLWLLTYNYQLYHVLSMYIESYSTAIFTDVEVNKCIKKNSKKPLSTYS